MLHYLADRKFNTIDWFCAFWGGHLLAYGHYWQSLVLLAVFTIISVLVEHFAK